MNRCSQNPAAWDPCNRFPTAEHSAVGLVAGEIEVTKFGATKRWENLDPLPSLFNETSKYEPLQDLFDYFCPPRPNEKGFFLLFFFDFFLIFLPIFVFPWDNAQSQSVMPNISKLEFMQLTSSIDGSEETYLFYKNSRHLESVVVTPPPKLTKAQPCLFWLIHLSIHSLILLRGPARK